MAASLLPLHLGALHPVEQALTLALAFGPFVLLGGVVVWRRRQDARLDERSGPDDPAGRPDRAPEVR